jgi:hypothetical protein
MAFSENIHPNGEWVKVDAMIWDKNSGSCVRVVLLDQAGNSYDLILHYGSEDNAYKFLSMLKKAVGDIPFKCPNCGRQT